MLVISFLGDQCNESLPGHWKRNHIVLSLENQFVMPSSDSKTKLRLCSACKGELSIGFYKDKTWSETLKIAMLLMKALTA